MNTKHISKVPEYIEETRTKKDGSTFIEKIPRRAIAPYNFVELPEQVVEAELPLPDGDRYHLERKTGRIECTLTTESPLYTRCGWNSEDFAKYAEPPTHKTKEERERWKKEEKAKWEKERKEILTPFFSYPGNNLPAISGSSLRGMLRTLVEIVSFSKIEKVSGHQRLFFRAVASDPKKESWGKEYKEYVDPKKIQAGYLKKDSEGWYIQPAKPEKGTTFAWVRETSLTLSDFKKFNDDLYQPQYIPVSYESVAEDPTDRAKRLFANNVELPDTYVKKGLLVTSGNMKQTEDKPSPRKNHCLVFDCLVFEPSSNTTKLRIDKVAIDHYLNALTDFQKEPPFEKNSGIFIEDNKPIFYLPPKNRDTVAFFGQSPNFRIPYSPEGNGHATTVVDFIPTEVNNPYVISWSNAPISFSVMLLNINSLVGILFLSIPLIDLADAIFGWVKQESKEKKLSKNFDKQRAGRVFVTDALCQNNQNGILYSETPVIPQILSEPKPVCFPHYLVQPNADKLELKHYASEPLTETVIRGHKLYWHKGSNPDFKLPPPQKVIGSPKKVSDTQTTLIKPIKKGVSFKFDIHFENLSDVELGVLLWILNIAKDEAYRLKLGMGKPLGLGAVKIEPALYLSSRQKRYEHLFNSNDNNWDKAESKQDISEYISKFETYMLKKLDYTGDFKNSCRIQMLLAMLSWPGITDVENNTRYMEITRGEKPKIGDDPNEYKQRPVLPDPLDVMREATGIKIECDRPSSSLLKKSTKQPTQQFLEGQEVEAKVISIEVQEGQKLKTTITYEIEGSDCLAKEEIRKKKISLEVGDTLKVSIVKAQGKSIRKVKRVE